jgi:hypothetical protein
MPDAFGWFHFVFVKYAFLFTNLNVSFIKSSISDPYFINSKSLQFIMMQSLCSAMAGGNRKVAIYIYIYLYIYVFSTLCIVDGQI